jgi:hypothetical protein
VEATADTSRTKRTLRTTEMNTLRKSARETKVDHVRNQVLREQCEIQPVGEWMNKDREEWNDHISRITEDSILWVIKDNSRKGGSRLGRPCKHWNDSL